MISILIPTHNYDCRPLVYEMYRQATKGKYPFEIIVADDCSSPDFRIINSEIEKSGIGKYIQLEENIGPARIRNFLISKAHFRYCLLMDVDTYPSNDSFIETYIQSAREGCIVCGGFSYKSGHHTGVCPLRQKYGIEVEEKSSHIRKKEPYKQFISMCFLADKEIFRKVSFNEKMHFGYEDACFGMELRNKKIPVIHIDNNVYHISQEDSATYLRKIEQSIRNIVPHKELMRPYVRLLAWQEKIEQFHLTYLTGLTFLILKPILHFNLTSKHPSLYLFAFYKLGYLCRLLTARKE